MTHAHAIRSCLALLALAALVGCRPAAAPSPSPGAGDIGHRTGATDVVLRYEEGGGFVAPGFLVTAGPWFTLYGDGTAIFRDRLAPQPARIGQVTISAPYFSVKLTDEQVQSLLQFAIGPGGLALAKDSYELPIADAPTTLFTLEAGGLERRVTVNGLGISVAASESAPDAQILGQLAALRMRLAGFSTAVDGEQPWVPDRYRGVLMESAGGDIAGAVAWPWPAIKVADFTRTGEPDGLQFPSRVMTPAEVASLGVGHLEGGATGFVLRPPGPPMGAPFRFAVRVLLPDEVR
jgi:hypothetical protein